MAAEEEPFVLVEPFSAEIQWDSHQSDAFLETESHTRTHSGSLS